MVLALIGGGYWYFSYRPVAQRDDAAYAALNRVTLPDGWRVQETLKLKYPSGRPYWDRYYIAPNLQSPDALRAISERLQRAGALPGKDRCYGNPTCISLVYPPKYRLTVGADDRDLAHESTCPEVPSCTQLRLSLEEWQPGDPD